MPVTAIGLSTSAERFNKLSNVPIYKSGAFDFVFNTDSLFTFKKNFSAHLKMILSVSLCLSKYTKE